MRVRMACSSVVLALWALCFQPCCFCASISTSCVYVLVVHAFFVELQIANISHSQPEARIQSGLANTRCILTYLLLILSSPCYLVNGGKEVNKRMNARQPSKSRHVTPHKRKGVTPFRRLKVFKRPYGIATDDMASTGSPKLPYNSPLGNAIRSYIKRLNHDQRSRLTRHMLYLKGSLKLSSSCSGSELLRMVAEYVMDEAGGEVDYVWSCESKPWKRRWIRDMAVSHFSVVRRLFSRSDINYVNRRAHFCPCVSGTLSSLSDAVVCDQSSLLNEMSFLL